MSMWNKKARGSRAVGVVEAPRAGYFIDSVDGLESVMEPDKVQNITVSQAKKLLSRKSCSAGFPRKYLPEESFSGVLNYRVASGTRVSQGGVIAEVYQSENDKLPPPSCFHASAIPMAFKRASSGARPSR